MIDILEEYWNDFSSYITCWKYSWSFFKNVWPPYNKERL